MKLSEPFTLSNPLKLVFRVVGVVVYTFRYHFCDLGLVFDNGLKLVTHRIQLTDQEIHPLKSYQLTVNNYYLYYRYENENF